MEESGFSFEDFSVEIRDFEFRQVRKFDRIFVIGEGGTFLSETSSVLASHKI